MVPISDFTRLAGMNNLLSLKYVLCFVFTFHFQLNDIRLDFVTHDVAVNEFRKADESVSLLVEKNAEAHILVS